MGAAETCLAAGQSRLRFTARQMTMREAVRVSTSRWLLWTLAPVLASIMLMVTVVAWGNGGMAKAVRLVAPHPMRDAQACNWACHNKGCRHGMKVVGPPIAGPLRGGKLRGLYGWTIDSLHSSGAYRLANLFVFCLLWPMGTLALWALVVRQRLALCALACSSSREHK